MSYKVLIRLGFICLFCIQNVTGNFFHFLLLWITVAVMARIFLFLRDLAFWTLKFVTYTNNPRVLAACRWHPLPSVMLRPLWTVMHDWWLLENITNFACSPWYYILYAPICFSLGRIKLSIGTSKFWKEKGKLHPNPNSWQQCVHLAGHTDKELPHTIFPRTFPRAPMKSKSIWIAVEESYVSGRRTSKYI